MKEFESRTCEVCGQPYMPVRSTQRYCSDTCYTKAHNIRHGHARAVPLEPRTCEVCGQPFIPHRINQTYCSLKCQRWVNNHNRQRRNPAVVRTCVICGKQFETGRLRQRACSPECSELLRHPKVVREPKVCPFCGKTFTPNVRASNQIFCSKECNNRSKRGYADIEDYNRVKAIRAAAAKASAERDTCGLTLAQRQEVIDAQNGDQSQLWKRSQSWTKAQHKYAKKRYEEMHGLFVMTFNP